MYLNLNGNFYQTGGNYRAAIIQLMLVATHLVLNHYEDLSKSLKL